MLHLRPVKPPVERGLAALAVLAAAAYLWVSGPGPDWLGPWVKPWPVAFLAFVVSMRGQGTLARLVTLGLAISAVADVVIGFAFLPGLALFLAAHLLYTAAFVTAERALRPLRALPFALYGVFMYALLFPGLGGLAVPVAGYVVAILTMMWRAAARVRAGDRAAWFGLAGALLFGCSDSLLAIDRFRGPLSGVDYAIMLSYWAGQLGIALSHPEGHTPGHRPEGSVPQDQHTPDPSLRSG